MDETGAWLLEGDPLSAGRPCALDQLERADAPRDERRGEAIEILVQSGPATGAGPTSRWAAGVVCFEMDSGRAPGRWNTRRALRILRWVGQE